MRHGKKKRTAKEGNNMGEALLTVKSLNAWYSNEKMILSDFSFALAGHEVAGLSGLNGAGITWSMYAPPMGKKFRMCRS